MTSRSCSVRVPPMNRLLPGSAVMVRRRRPKAWSDGVEAYRPYDDPEKKDWFAGECAKIGLKAETATLPEKWAGDFHHRPFCSSMLFCQTLPSKKHRYENSFEDIWHNSRLSEALRRGM
jgi:hypothetical protein